MNDKWAPDTLTKTVSSASEISYVDYDVSKRLAPPVPVGLNASLLSPAPELKSHTLVTYAPPLVKEMRQERSSSALIGELESNCSTVSRLASLISTDSQAMSKYVEQTKHTLSLSVSENSAAALRNMKAILDTVSDSSSGSSDKISGFRTNTTLESVSKNNTNSVEVSIETVDSKQSPLYQQHQSDVLPGLPTTVSAYAFTPTGKQTSSSTASPLQITLCAKEVYQGDIQSAALSTSAAYNQTPEPTFIRPHSVSLQSIMSTEKARLQPPPIREVPDEIIGPPITQQRELPSALPSVSHCTDSSVPFSSVPWKPGTTVHTDNLPLSTIKNYFSTIENLDNFYINKINPEDCFPIDDGYLRRLQYEISAIRRYMNLNISARDAELARLDREIQVLKQNHKQHTSLSSESAAINDLAGQKLQVDESAVKVVFPSPFSTHSSNPGALLELESLGTSANNIENKQVKSLVPSDLGSLIVTPEMIENCFSSIGSTLPGVSSLADTSKMLKSCINTQTGLISDKIPNSESPDLIREYTTGNLTELKAELARTRDEAMRIIREKDAEIAEMRRNLAATKSVTSASTSVATSLVSTLHDKANSLVGSRSTLFDSKSINEKPELFDKCNTPIPRTMDSDSLQISALPTSSAAILASVTHPEDTCSNISTTSAQTVIHSSIQARKSPQYSISVSSTSDLPLDRSISVTEDQSLLSSKLTTSKLGTSHLKLALSTVAKSGTIPPKPPAINTLLPLTYSIETPLHDEYLPSPSSSRSDSVEMVPKHQLMISGSHTPMSASPAHAIFERNNLVTAMSEGPHVNFMVQSSFAIPQASRAPDILASSGSLMSNSSYLCDMDTGDQRDDEFLRLEQEVKTTHSQLVRSLANTYLSDTYRSSDFAGVVIDTFSAPSQVDTLQRANK